MEEKKKRVFWQIPFLLFLIIGTYWTARHRTGETVGDSDQSFVERMSSIFQKKEPYQNEEGMIFGTTYHIQYQYNSSLQKEITARLQEVDASLSMFNPKSTIARINSEETNCTDSLLIQVFGISQKISEATDGAFDVTVAPLVNAWGFGFKNGEMPTPQQVDSLLTMVGWRSVRLEGDRIIKDNPATTIDFSAVAKGYGADRVAQLLEEKGIKNYMVEIGGEVVVKGENAEGKSWAIGVNKPVEDSSGSNTELQTILHLTDRAMATSGNYRNFYIRDGKKVAHTIDPKTGHPVQHSLLSATVLAQNCATADGFATSFMVMGVDRAKQVLKKHPELMAYFIYADKEGKNKVWYSPQLKQYIHE